MRRVTTPRDMDALLDDSPRLFGVPAGPLAALVVANLLPLVGVFAFGWDARGLLLLYWAENVVVAFWTAARMLVVGGASAAPMVGFFAVHYGIFTFVHLIFVLVLTAPGGFAGAAGPGATNPVEQIGGGGVVSAVSWWALAALVVSHAFAFFRNFLGRGEWKVATVQGEMFRPYPRMIVLHVAIVAGAFVAVLAGGAVAILAILVLLKTGLDAAGHVAEHRARGARTAENVLT